MAEKMEDSIIELRSLGAPTETILSLLTEAVSAKILAMKETLVNSAQAPDEE